MDHGPPIEVFVRSSPSVEWKAIAWKEFERSSKQLIEKLKLASKRSVQRGDRFTRECVPCRNVNPRKRSVAVQCGHLVCSNCAATAKKCPICKIATSFLRIYEESTRECAVCCEIPLQRTCFNPCGHVVCTACILELRLLAARNRAPFRCSYCQTSAVSGGYKPLDEELIQKEIKRREQDEILERKKKKEARYRLKSEIEKPDGKAALWHAQRLERKHHQGRSTNNNFIRPNKGMVRVNQPMKQQNFGRR